jgi:hypothetical protein
VNPVKAISIELIRTDGGTQIRDCKTMQTKIEEYAVALGEGADFPPLTVFWDGEQYWLADGFHRLGAYNICMQALKLPGLDIECEVIEGSLREAIIFACGVNAAHGIQRTVPDKQNAVRTMLTNPLVSTNLETGKPWNDVEIARRCFVSDRMVAKHRAELAAERAERAKQSIIETFDDSERTVTRGGTTYTMKTANIGAKAEQAKAEQVASPAPVPDPQPEAGAPAKSAEVVQFTSPHDYLYDLLAQIDRAMAALPAPNVVAFELPVAHRPELVPTGPEQCRHLPPPGNRFGRTAPMFQSVLVAWLAANPINAAVEPTAGSPRHSR